jgi:hypothetical protein
MKFGAMSSHRSLKSRMRKFAMYKERSDISQKYHSQFAVTKGGPEQYLNFFLLWSLENPILNNYMVVSQVPGEIRSLNWHKLEINTFYI